jgi:hypothetical protein
MSIAQPAEQAGETLNDREFVERPYFAKAS